MLISRTIRMSDGTTTQQVGPANDFNPCIEKLLELHEPTNVIITQKNGVQLIFEKVDA